MDEIRGSKTQQLFILASELYRQDSDAHARMYKTALNYDSSTQYHLIRFIFLRILLVSLSARRS